MARRKKRSHQEKGEDIVPAAYVPATPTAHEADEGSDTEAAAAGAPITLLTTTNMLEDESEQALTGVPNKDDAAHRSHKKKKTNDEAEAGEASLPEMTKERNNPDDARDAEAAAKAIRDSPETTEEEAIVAQAIDSEKMKALPMSKFRLNVSDENFKQLHKIWRLDLIIVSYSGYYSNFE